MKKNHFKKQLDTIVNLQNKHTIEDQGGSCTTPFKNCLGAMFWYGFHKASCILGKLDILKNQKNGTKKLRNKSYYSKGKEKTNFWKTNHFKKQLDTIGNPQNKHTIEDQGGSWATPLEKLFGCNVLMVF